MLHRDHCPRHAALLCLARDVRVRHEAERLRAELRERRLADARERHVRICDDGRAVAQGGLGLLDHVRRKREVIRIIKIRRRVDDALDDLGDAVRKRARAQLLRDDLERALFNILRLHVSVQNSIPSRAATPFSYGCRRFCISVI